MERLRSAGEQQQQVVARVGIERRENLLDVDVRLRVRDRQGRSDRHRAGVLRSRIERQVHVLERRARTQQHGRVVVDRGVLLVDVHRHDRAAALEVDRADLPDLDTRDVDRLALSGRHRCSGRELGLDRVVALAEPERRLVLEDVDGDGDRRDDEREDRDEVLPVDADGALHEPGPVFTRLRSGFGFL